MTDSSIELPEHVQCSLMTWQHGRVTSNPVVAEACHRDHETELLVGATPAGLANKTIDNFGVFDKKEDRRAVQNLSAIGFAWIQQQRRTNDD